MKKTGWFNKNKLGYSVKHESHRHSLASKGIKTSAPKSPKGFSTNGTPTPNFDMVARRKKLVDFNIGDSVKITNTKPIRGLKGIVTGINPKSKQYRILTSRGTIIKSVEDLKKTDMLKSQKWRDTRTGEIVTQFDIMDIEYMVRVPETDMVIGKGIDFPMDEFHKGIKVETEHGKTVNYDPITIARITLDHLEEDKEYYRKLAIMESNVKNPKFDMSNMDLGDLFFRGASKGKTQHLKIIDKSDKTQLVGYDWAVYGERNKKTGKVTYFKGWDGCSPTTSKQLKQLGLKTKSDIVIDKMKDVDYNMSLTSLTKSLKKVSKDVSKTAHNISKKIEAHNIKREADAQKKLDHDIEVAKQQLKLKKMQSKSDLLEIEHKESVQRQRQELARINKELEKGTTKAKAKELSKKAGKEGLKLAGIIAKGVAKEVKEVIFTEPPKKKKK